MELQDEVREIAKVQTVYAEKMNSMDEKMDKVLHALEGNGKPGLLTRVDRLEQTVKLRTRFSWMIVAAALGAIATKLVGG